MYMKRKELLKDIYCQIGKRTRTAQINWGVNGAVDSSCMADLSSGHGMMVSYS